MNAEFLLKSSSIFTSVSDKPISGYVAVGGGKILSVGREEQMSDWQGKETMVYELGNKTVCAGFADVHTFFIGHVLRSVGVNLIGEKTPEAVIAFIKKQASGAPAGKALLGHNWDSEAFSPGDAMLDAAFPDRAVILFSANHRTCWMNTAARKAYLFTPETCYPEAYWRLLREVLGDREAIMGKFIDYMRMLNARGVTAVKEMGYDDYYGFTDVLEALEKEEKMTVRVSFMSQAVGKGADMDYGVFMRDRFKGDFVQFSGFNQMTDGSMGDYGSHLLAPYNDKPDTICDQVIDYQTIEKDTLAADALGFRFSLHAQGDGAAHKILSIYDKCRMKDGKLVNRHAMTDLELIADDDIAHMARLGVTAEVYAQIMSLSARESFLHEVNEKLGAERIDKYWNLRKMADEGVNISCATDLPLLYPDIPEAIYHASGCRFPEGGEPYNEKNGLTREEVLKAWTIGGQTNLYNEARLGTLEAGKLADIAVLDGNVLSAPMDTIRDIKVLMTICGGKVVYSAK